MARTLSTAQKKALARGRAKLKAMRRRGEKPKRKTVRKTNPKDCIFTFKPQAELGVKSNMVNVYCGRKLIGYLEAKNIPAFKKNKTSGFKPISNWRNTFSVRLKERLGLRTRKINPDPALMRTGVLRSATKAGKKRLTNPPHYVISNGKNFFDGASWVTSKKDAAQYMTQKKAGQIGRVLADLTNKPVQVVPV